MKERPILFSGPMIRAILEGRKTQTRRVVKLPPHIKHHELDLTRMQDGYPDGVRPIWGDDDEPNLFSTRNPYGQPGFSRLWVKETHGFWCHSVESVGVQYAAGGEDKIVDFPDGNGMPSLDVQARRNRDGSRRMRPSIFMPRWASRITLEITGVRVERLQEISEEDAKAEGCCGVTSTEFGTPNFRWLWQSINGPGSWDSNPWVWVVEFKRVEGSR